MNLAYWKSVDVEVGRHGQGMRLGVQGAAE
jgi:hypothetical protein